MYSTCKSSHDQLAKQAVQLIASYSASDQEFWDKYKDDQYVQKLFNPTVALTQLEGIKDIFCRDRNVLNDKDYNLFSMARGEPGVDRAQEAYWNLGFVQFQSHFFKVIKSSQVLMHHDKNKIIQKCLLLKLLLYRFNAIILSAIDLESQHENLESETSIKAKSAAYQKLQDCYQHIQKCVLSFNKQLFLENAIAQNAMNYNDFQAFMIISMGIRFLNDAEKALTGSVEHSSMNALIEKIKSYK